MQSTVDGHKILTFPETQVSKAELSMSPPVKPGDSLWRVKGKKSHEAHLMPLPSSVEK